MAKPFTRGGITYSSQAAYRKALAARQGFASRAARTKVVKAERSLASLTKSQRQARGRVLDALSLIREGVPINKAVERAGTTRSSLARYGGDAVRREGGRLVISDTDTLPRRMKVVTPDGVRFETLLSGRDARIVGQYSADLKRYLLTGDASLLRKWQGVTVTARGKQVPLASDPADLQDLARAGELDFDDLYEFD